MFNWAKDADTNSVNIKPGNTFMTFILIGLQENYLFGIQFFIDSLMLQEVARTVKIKKGSRVGFLSLLIHYKSILLRLPTLVVP
jgi:hypothetical protein